LSNVEAVVDTLVRDFQPFLVVLSGPRALVVVPDDREHRAVLRTCPSRARGCTQHVLGRDGRVALTEGSFGAGRRWARRTCVFITLIESRAALLARLANAVADRADDLGRALRR
jgi:hypothetical protein